MPLELIKITEPNEAQFADLLKIYDGYADTDPTSIRQWLELQLKNGFFIFGGIFNGRLVASSIASDLSGDIQLANVCVREITRRRGVARQMLMLICRYANQHAVKITISMAITPTALHPLLQEHGFVEDKLVWSYTPRSLK